MGDKTKIDWCDATWNPVTGCLHGCEYCYARRIAERFGARMKPIFVDFAILDKPVRSAYTYGSWRNLEINEGRIQPYPFDFTPTFHRYRLEDVRHWQKPRTIFVCSMADLFGNWVPDNWIEDVFEACEGAPWHRYLFLTKNPERLYDLARRQALPRGENFWYGCSVTKPDMRFFFSDLHNTFASIEPILECFGNWGPGRGQLPGWIIIGAETGNRKGKVIPEKAWVEEIARQANENRIPIFMKESLRGIMGEDFRQEFPW